MKSLFFCTRSPHHPRILTIQPDYCTFSVHPSEKIHLNLKNTSDAILVRAQPKCKFCKNIPSSSSSSFLCPRCKTVYYCSETCRKKDQVRHRVPCERISCHLQRRDYAVALFVHMNDFPYPEPSVWINIFHIMWRFIHEEKLHPDQFIWVNQFFYDSFLQDAVFDRYSHPLTHITTSGISYTPWMQQMIERFFEHGFSKSILVEQLGQISKGHPLMDLVLAHGEDLLVPIIQSPNQFPLLVWLHRQEHYHKEWSTHSNNQFLRKKTGRLYLDNFLAPNCFFSRLSMDKDRKMILKYLCLQEYHFSFHENDHEFWMIPILERYSGESRKQQIQNGSQVFFFPKDVLGLILDYFY